MAGWLTAERVRRHTAALRDLVLDRGDGRSRHAKRYAFDLAGLVTPALVAHCGEERYLVDTRDRIIGRESFAGGVYDRDLMVRTHELLCELLGRNPVEARVFVDVGANIGTTSILAARNWGASRVVSIEPEPNNFDYLRCNAILNGVEDRLLALPNAVSDTSADVQFQLCPTNSGDNRVSSGRHGGDYGEDEWVTITVRAEPLEELLTANGVRTDEVGLVWVDTQGHERHVLSTASGLISRGVPFVVEYWPYGLDRIGATQALGELIQEKFSLVVDVRRGGLKRPATEMADLVEGIGRAPTDLILIP